MTEFKENLHILRRRKDLSQIELAKLCEMHNATISLYEKGKIVPSLTVINKLVRILGCTYTDLLGEIEEPEKQTTL